MADDFSELRVLAADLSEAPAKAQPLIKKALQKTAFDIKRDWRKRANRTGLRKYSADIDYEVKTPAGLIEVEIGPTIGDSGSFGLVEDGGGNVRSRPQHAARDSLRDNEQDFIKGIEIALFDATREAIE
uniref:HK97 gp10 family phage protein n=1 Tax=Microbacterium proteolyticum TaxID=1572644 RepID=UPI002416C869|nr:HK97 gp10 family phage protein [Microbacterium proteolyticum]